MRSQSIWQFWITRRWIIVDSRRQKQKKKQEFLLASTYLSSLHPQHFAPHFTILWWDLRMLELPCRRSQWQSIWSINCTWNNGSSHWFVRCSPWKDRSPELIAMLSTRADCSEIFSSWMIGDHWKLSFNKWRGGSRDRYIKDWGSYRIP